VTVRKSVDRDLDDIIQQFQDFIGNPAAFVADDQRRLTRKRELVQRTGTGRLLKTDEPITFSLTSYSGWIHHQAEAAWGIRTAKAARATIIHPVLLDAGVRLFCITFLLSRVE